MTHEAAHPDAAHRPRAGAAVETVTTVKIAKAGMRISKIQNLVVTRKHTTHSLFQVIPSQNLNRARSLILAHQYRAHHATCGRKVAPRDTRPEMASFVRNVG